MNRPGPDPAPLPVELGALFSVRDATSTDVEPHRVRAADLEHPYWGLRSREAVLNLEGRCRLLQLRMPPESFFSHSTAAQLHGIPVSYRLSRRVEVHITTPAPSRAPHASGLRGHRLTIDPRDLTAISGIRVTTPPRTWCDLATQLPLLDLVAAGDFIIRHSQTEYTLVDLEAARKRQKSPRGRALLMRAIPLLNSRSESPQESILRVLLVQAGFTNIQVNHESYTEDGEFIARTDLLLVNENLVLEYQGDYHCTGKGQYRSDMSRRSRLEARGRRVMELNADDLLDPVELTARIRRRAAQPH